MGVLVEDLNEERLAAGRTGLMRITPTEHRVIKASILGASTRVVGAELGMSSRTAEVHLRRVYAKLGVRNREEALQMVLAVQDDPAVIEYLTKLGVERPPGGRPKVE